MHSIGLVYSDGYELPIGSHVFPSRKYKLVHDQLLASGVAVPADFSQPEPASDEDVLRVHTASYVQKLKTGTLSPQEEQLLEVPYSAELVAAFWLHAGGSILAANLALQHGAAVNIGGGFHHAFAGHGEGFCMIHDVAIAIRSLQAKGTIGRAMVVDCDVHHGNGTASIFGHPRPPAAPLPSQGPATLTGTSAGRVENSPSTASDTSQPGVFTISLHQESNYPVLKPPSSIDVNLPDGIGDEQYLGWLDNALSSGLRQFTPDLLCYIAGADPYREDQLGGLALTLNGLRQRDELLFRMARSRGIPVMVTFAGGYARNVEDTVKIHCNTVAAANDVFQDRSAFTI
ncbi:MAG TPA: histone deacetylase [Terriglobales bacterium]|nr:histone deacetylase [Terriglobales bacterium]